MADAIVFQEDELRAAPLPAVSVAMVLNRRGNQQDAALVSPFVLAVADGLGGHRDGEVASRAALEMLAAQIVAASDGDGLVAAARAANERVCELADASRLNPGTTLVAVCVGGPGVVHGVWCGDSRAYLVKPSGELVQITSDHGRGSQLSSCLGDHGQMVTPKMGTFSLETGHGYRLLLTTDGVHDSYGALLNGAVEELAGVDVRQLRKLVVGACEYGTDNATAVLADVDEWVATAAG